MLALLRILIEITADKILQKADIPVAFLERAQAFQQRIICSGKAVAYRLDLVRAAGDVVLRAVWVDDRKSTSFLFGEE